MDIEKWEKTTQIPSHVTTCHKYCDSGWKYVNGIGSNKLKYPGNSRGKQGFTLVRPDRFELPTYWFVVIRLAFRKYIIINKLCLFYFALLTKFWLLFFLADIKNANLHNRNFFFELRWLFYGNEWSAPIFDPFLKEKSGTKGGEYPYK